MHGKLQIVQEESFGPILTVERFRDEEEVIRFANDTVYGFAEAVCTIDQNKTHRVTRALRIGTVWITDYHHYFAPAPWGGNKQSGIGRELGHTGLEEYTEQKHIFQNHQSQPMNWFGV
jgi:betaine-aldehyde dehydrogenase